MLPMLLSINSLSPKLFVKQNSRHLCTGEVLLQDLVALNHVGQLLLETGCGVLVPILSRFAP